jgi:hypothetical protein
LLPVRCLRRMSDEIKIFIVTLVALALIGLGIFIYAR